MDTKTFVEHTFNQTIKGIFATKKPAVYNFLNKHERKQLAINNLLQRISDEGLTLERSQLEYLAKSTAKMFCSIALEHAEKEANPLKWKMDKEKKMPNHVDHGIQEVDKSEGLDG